MRSFPFVVGVQRRVASNKPRLIIIAGVVVSLLASYVAITTAMADAAETPYSQGKPVTASSTEFGATPAGGRGRRQTPVPAGRVDSPNSPMAFGSIWARSRPSVGSCCAGRPPMRPRTRSRPPSMAQPGRTSTAPRPPAAAPRP